MTTKEQRREKRYRLIVEAIHRWGVKLEKADRTVKRSVRMIAKLERARQRAEKQMKAETQPQPEPPTSFVVRKRENYNPEREAPIMSVELVPDDIPTFLQREPNKKDEQARAEIEAQQAADKRRKAELSAEKRKVKQEVRDADLTGLRRKMPLTGRAALDALK